MRRVAAALGVSALVACGGPLADGFGRIGRDAGAGAGAERLACGHDRPAGERRDGPAGRRAAARGGRRRAGGTPLASSASEAVTVDVTIAGFLPRQTLVRTGETRLVLWPDSRGLPGDYTRALVSRRPEAGLAGRDATPGDGGAHGRRSFRRRRSRPIRRQWRRTGTPSRR